MLGVFLLGLCTRRTTSRGATVALVVAAAFALLATWGPLLGALTSTDIAPGPFCTLPLAVGLTLVTGFLLSCAVGSRKSNDELAGLVIGRGRLGVLLELNEEEEEEEEICWVETNEDEGPEDEGPVDEISWS